MGIASKLVKGCLGVGVELPQLVLPAPHGLGGRLGGDLGGGLRANTLLQLLSTALCTGTHLQLLSAAPPGLCAGD